MMPDALWLPETVTTPASSGIVTPDGTVVKKSPAVMVRKSPLDKIKAEPTAPPAWRRRLAEFWPVSETTQWLLPRMFPEAISKQTGYPIPGSARWVLYTMTPAALISDPTKIEQLDGKPWWELPEDKQFGRMQMVTAFQYWCWREYRCWARPYWCLQGEHGGTPMQYTMREQAILRAAQLPTDVPNPGDLPFAGLDERAITALLDRDRFRKMGSQIDRLKDLDKAAADVKAEEEEAELVFRTHFVKWFKDRTEANADFINWHSNKSENGGDFKPATKGEERAAAEWEDHYIRTGKVPSAMQYEDR